MLNIQKQYMGTNFASALFVLGGVGMGVHFEQLMQFFEGVPLVMAYGVPVSGKSTAVQCAMGVIGQEDKIGGK